MLKAILLTLFLAKTIKSVLPGLSRGQTLKEGVDMAPAYNPDL